MQVVGDWRKDEVGMGHTNYAAVEGMCPVQYFGREYFTALEMQGCSGAINHTFVPEIQHCHLIQTAAALTIQFAAEFVIPFLVL